jgi:hypothetical protein
MSHLDAPIIPDPQLSDRHATSQHAAHRLAAQARFVRLLGRRGATGGEAAATQAEAIWAAALHPGAPVANPHTHAEATQLA